jgi:hypothetical protein
MHTVLTRSEFESAVKRALRHYTQADLLAENALLQTRLLSCSGQGTVTPQALRTLLAETAQTLFANERDQRVYRVFDLTYFNPAPKGLNSLAFPRSDKYLHSRLPNGFPSSTMARQVITVGCPRPAATKSRIECEEAHNRKAIVSEQLVRRVILPA